MAQMILQWEEDLHCMDYSSRLGASIMVVVMKEEGTRSYINWNRISVEVGMHPGVKFGLSSLVRLDCSDL